MEDLTKNSNFSPRKKKVRDLIRKDKEKKEQTPPQSMHYSLPDKYCKFEITSKNKELMKFKNDILAYFRDRDNFYLEKLKELKSQADITDKNLDNLSDTTNKNFNNFLVYQAEINTKLDKVKAFDAFVNKANDKLISHEIRINCVREDLTKTIQKYDKIYLENLEVPGYIGRCSKYANCKIFFSEMIKEMDKFNTYREKNTIDLCTYKERLENIIKTFQSLVDNNNDSQIKYITKLNDKTNKYLLETLEEKISNVRVDNSKFAIDLINKSTELKELYDKMNRMKDSILKEFNVKAEEFNKKIDETNKSFDDYKVEYASIRKKFLELSDFIKSGRFSRNFGSIFGKKEINSISKKLVKETRESIDAKDVKLLDNIEDIEKIEVKQKCNIDIKNKNNKNNNNYVNNNNCNNTNVNNKDNKDVNKFSKSQNNFYINNNIGKKKMFGFDQNNINNHKNNEKNEKTRNSVDNSNNVMKVHQGILFYLGNSNGDNSSKKANKNNLIKEKEINIKQVKNSIIPIGKKEIPIQNIENEPKSKNNEDLLDIKISKVQKEEKKSSLTEELSMSESYISNINNSINTFSTTNEKNNSLNTLINLNNNKCNKFNLFEEELQHNDKIIKELESELEQSTAKVNKLASNKKEIEDNFKSICNKIQPMNLKLNKNPPLENIPECKEKDKYSVTNKSEQNTTLVSNNINNLNNSKNSHINHENLNKTNSTMNKKGKLREIVDSNEKRDENNVTVKSSRSKYANKNNTNENLLNETINFSIDKKMNVYDKKLGDLESFTKEQIFELIKQINIIKKSYSYLTNIIKKESSTNSKISNGYNTNHNAFDTSHGSGSLSSNNNNNNNNENQNSLNLTGNNFYKKTLKNDIIKFGSNKKIIQTMDDINFSDNLFYNGKYYFNIKDIFEKNRNSLNLNMENRRLLKQIDNKFLEENAGRNRSNSSSNKNIHFKSNNTSLGGADNKWVDLKKLGNKTAKYNKKQKPQSGVYPCPLLVSGEK